ncbi:DUF805 domain-containing protein [Psychrobacter sp. I-STPA6b]|uniref:DUF805 domain-containing protein n=1 Tax=Psychrobacter sp. I-STPA6b TaxID=2585718 RepID=UPI001D0CD3E1|nr:DUF805 domain-containing protein [Psychrobacter sp. I-STPA6b]
MKGKVLSFYTQQNQGFIMGEDGHKYSFFGTGWQENEVPKGGDQVEFVVDATGQAINIVYATLATPVNLFKSQQEERYSDASERNATLGNVYASPTSQVSPTYNSAQDALYAEEEGYNLIDWTKKCLQNYANFNGRARRQEYWFFYLAQVIINFVLGMILGILSGVIGADMSWVVNIIGLAFALPTFAVGARRLHDIGKSGWWQLLWLVLIIGWIPLIIWLATDTKPEHNKWGAPARRV